MVDLDAAIGFVVAYGDAVERARLSRLRTGAPAPAGLLDAAEAGQAPGGGWPAVLDGEVASVDATCYRLAELDDLGGLSRPAARHALDWLAARQLPDGGWDEDPSLAGFAPEWATPGDPEARLYLTAYAGFWLTVAGLDARAAGPLDHRVGGAYAGVVQAAAQALAAQLAPDGSWPSFLPAGWLAAAVLHRQQMYYESARIQAVLADRIPEMSPADVAWLAATLHRVEVGEEQWLLVAARRRLAETQRSDGGWDSDDGHQFDVHTTLRAIRACLPAEPAATPVGPPRVPLQPSARVLPLPRPCRRSLRPRCPRRRCPRPRRPRPRCPRRRCPRPRRPRRRRPGRRSLRRRCPPRRRPHRRSLRHRSLRGSFRLAGPRTGATSPGRPRSSTCRSRKRAPGAMPQV
ncbi:Prenyltransferase and squalene oxidase repeat-containing protein [Micromonospora viridifaciens]|uniref:Prenyltransferase and squalene oxidase repeat-containing protein n=1 Tax=Micromonospora viridifaciens TaxID=1881 RepID=A0A1C4UZK2_MICVI|nr:Prenyltransferase and squalene oxidase repeat-containing protein [Micromonospora viridifaciens]